MQCLWDIFKSQGIWRKNCWRCGDILVDDTGVSIVKLPQWWQQGRFYFYRNCKYRITAILKVESDIVANISASPIGWAGILVIMFVEAFRTDVIAFNGHVIMCFRSDWPMKVTNWSNIFVDQGQTLSAALIKGKMSNLLINLKTLVAFKNSFCSWHVFGSMVL